MPVTFTRGISASSVNAAFSAGQQLTLGTIYATSHSWVGATADLSWNGRTAIFAPTDGGLEIRNNAGTTFVGLANEGNDLFSQRRGANAQNFRVYNFFTDASNFERGVIGWSGNVFKITADYLGTGVSRGLQLIASGSTVIGIEDGYTGSASVSVRRDGTSGSTQFLVGGAGLTATGLLHTRLTPTINQASGTYTVLDVNPTETAIGAGPHYLIQGRLGAAGAASTFGVDRLGAYRSSLGAALTAGGTTTYGYFMSSANLGMIGGSGVPTVSAPKGTLYLRSDGSSTITRAYINTDGATTWTALTTVA
ncbi:hypothetical protein UFOVP1339_54 [uncultured Caudovirales phage]|uniref:Uncharacterized protein n=1 Tax=uncultured Caudovirales phage TaxID=2100421 RepID=A0A6J5RT75_9CAUD|nr:hypothetical protein UFOVP1339_54 [uncultured Caudovirales phage]